MQAMGLAIIFIGITGTIKGMMTVEPNGSLGVNGTMLMIVSLSLGSVIGAALDIETRLDNMGVWLKNRVKVGSDSRFVEGFVTSSLVICVGAMAVVGSLQDGLSGDAMMLYTKSVLDFMIVIIFASTLGVGVLFSALPLFLYQGGITLFAGLLAPLLSDVVIGDLSMVGNVLICGVGVNVAFGKKLAVGNMLPALLIPFFWHLIA